MKRWRTWMTLWVTILLFGGCSGVIHEAHLQDGMGERLLMENLDGWTSWDHRFTNKHEEMGAVLKGQITF